MALEKKDVELIVAAIDATIETKLPQHLGPMESRILKRIDELEASVLDKRMATLEKKVATLIEKHDDDVTSLRKSMAMH